MAWRASRIVNRFASVAVSANCQIGRPKRALNSSAQAIASSVGSISVVPLRTWSQTASAVAAGAWPVMAPVSPRHRSTYSIPSTSVKRAPEASATKTGNAPAHSTIQCIGTPASSERPARAWSACERGCSATKRSSSRARSRASRSRSTVSPLTGVCAFCESRSVYPA